MNLQIGDNKNLDEENARFYNFAMERMRIARMENIAIMAKKEAERRERERIQKEEDFKKQLPMLIVIAVILAILFL